MKISAVFAYSTNCCCCCAYCCYFPTASAVCSLHLHSATSYIYCEWKKKQGRRRIRTCYVALKYLFTLLLALLRTYMKFIHLQAWIFSHFKFPSQLPSCYLIFIAFLHLLTAAFLCSHLPTVPGRRASAKNKYLLPPVIFIILECSLTLHLEEFSPPWRRSVWRMFVWFMHTRRCCWLRGDDDISSNSGAIWWLWKPLNRFGSVQDDGVKLLEKSLENCLFFTCEGARRCGDL